MDETPKGVLPQLFLTSSILGPTVTFHNMNLLKQPLSVTLYSEWLLGHVVGEQLEKSQERYIK